MPGSPADTERPAGASTAGSAASGAAAAGAAHQASPDQASAPGKASGDRDLGELAQSLYQGAGDSLRAARDSATALGALLRADLALARSALVHGAVLALVAISFAAATWLLLVALAVVGLQAAGLSLAAALAIAAGASLLLGFACAWLARRCIAAADLAATRRQLTRLRHGAERDGDDAGSEHDPEHAP